MDKIRQYFNHPGFVGSFAAAAAARPRSLPAGTATTFDLIFTAHSIPVAMAECQRPGGRAPTRLSSPRRPGWSRPRSATSGRGTWRTQAAAARRRSRGSSPTSTTCWPSGRPPASQGGRGRADRLRQRPHGGQVRPRRRGGADRATARPGVRQGRDAGHRPAVRLDDHRPGLRAARRHGAAGARRARRRPGRRARPAAAARAGPAARRARERGPAAGPSPTRPPRWSSWPGPSRARPASCC